MTNPESSTNSADPLSSSKCLSPHCFYGLLCICLDVLQTRMINLIVLYLQRTKQQKDNVSNQQVST